VLFGEPRPLVGTWHAAGKLIAEPMLRKPMKAVARRVTLRCAVSEAAKALAERACGGRYTVLFNGVEVERFARAEPWPATRPAILFVGRHEPRKGLRVLLDAFAGIGDDVDLWVAGDGPETDELRARNLANVEWLGRISDEERNRRLRAATIFCAPALGGESFGVVLLEAMAAGAPVVASGISGYANVARDGIDGLLVPPGDALALRATLRTLLDHPLRRAELVDAGEARAAEYSMRHLAERYVTVYESAISLSAVHSP
jgi:phosphatidylinositol alpha-mannosyltransferase